VVFNTPGANANAVAELVTGMLIAGSRNLAAAAQWTPGPDRRTAAMAKSRGKGQKAVRRQRDQGQDPRRHRPRRHRLAKVANCAIDLGMEVYGYDPYISIDAAWSLSQRVRHCVNLNDMLPLCDYLTIHVPYLPTTKDTINAQTLALCKDGVRILNYARGELVNNAAILEALDSGKVTCYMTDFPCEELLGRAGVICTPHLGASTPEAEDNCAAMAAAEISDYLRNGNITPLGEPARREPGPRRRAAHLHHPPQRARRHQQDHRHDHRGQPEHRKHGEQEQKGYGLHHAGCNGRHRPEDDRKARRGPRRDPRASAVIFRF
jgi:D-3-phosphoglycerate dehydrogenase